MRSFGYILASGATALVAAGGLVACDGAELSDQPVEQATTSPNGFTLADVPPTALREVELARFEGVADPLTGAFEISMHPATLPEGVSEADGLRMAHQALWCDYEFVNDGVPGSGPAGTVELFSVRAPTSSYPFESLPEGCTTAEGVALGDLRLTGAFCAPIRLQSFVAGPLSNVHAELVEFGGTPLQRGARYPAGTGAQPPAGADTLSDEYGLWRYGDIGAAGGGADTAEQIWVFENGTPGPFTFRGRVVASAASCPDGGAP